MNAIDRRTFVQRTGLAGLSFLALNLASRAVADPDPPPGAATAPATGSPDPDIFSFQLGGTDAHVIHDGSISFPGIQPSFAPEAKASEVEELMKKNYLAADHLALSINVLVVKAKSGVMLFDAGAGKAMGPNAGKLLRGLARLGISPDDVKSVFVTHAHPDHIAGLVGESKASPFSGARVIIAKSESAFWTSDSPDLSGMRTPPDTTKQVAETVKGLLNGIKSSLDLKEPGRLTPEVELIAAPGHTPGHSAFQITIGDDKLLVIGDAVHVYALQFPHPEWTMMFDTDPAQAIKTRKRIFKDAAEQRTTLMGYHVPFPGIGHVRSAGAGFEWVPRPWLV